MSVFYFPHNRYATLSEPQFTRLRHRYRGPRESEKFNLEIHQMAYSLYRLHEQFEAIRNRYLEALEIAISGGDVRDQAVLDEAGVALTITGLEDLVSRAQGLIHRVQVLTATPAEPQARTFESVALALAVQDPSIASGMVARTLESATLALDVQDPSVASGMVARTFESATFTLAAQTLESLNG